MKDGRYEIKFRTGGYIGSGHAEVADEHLSGHDGSFSFEGDVDSGRPQIRSSLDVQVEKSFTHNAQIPPRFTMQLTGTSTDASFSLVGTGPLGVIVQIEGIWKSAGMVVQH